jgi:tetratricopeptide (TPR) repeat protein
MNEWHEAEERVEKARNLFEQRRWHEALDELRAAIALNPYNANWFFNVGLTLDELQRFDEALDAYRQALEIDPEDLQAMNHLGVDLCRVGNYDDAVATFQKVERIDASFEPAYCNRIIAYTELGDHQSAEEMFYLARLYKEHCPHCYYNMGSSLAARELYDKAIYCWQKTLDLDEDHPEVHPRIAEALRAKGRLEQARRHYLLAVRQNPGNVQTLLDLGELLLEMGRLEEAGEKFRRAIELAPDEPAAYLYHGQWLFKSGRLEEASAAYTKTLALEPRYPSTHVRLAEVYKAKGNLEQARWHLRRELLLRPEDPHLLLDLGDLLLDCADHRTAIACLKRLVMLDPENLAGWQNLAVAQFALHRMEDGILSCHEALRREPTSAVTHYNLALAYERLGQYDQALIWARKGLTQSPQDHSLSKLQFRIHVLRVLSTLKHLVRRKSR